MKDLLPKTTLKDELKSYNQAHQLIKGNKMAAKLILNKDREKSLLRRHPWIFASAVAEIKGRANLGDTIDIMSHDGKWLARGAYSPHSQIRARVWTFDSQQSIDNVFFKARLKEAHEKRQSLIDKHDTNAYRLIAAESDGLPGITIDVYANIVVIQLLSAGAEKHRDKIISAIESIYPACIIHERSDVDVRKKEGLEPLVQTLKGDLPSSVEIKENGIKIQVDLINGHKTGFYLDQRQNRLNAGLLCKDKSVLNCFSYTGTFGLYALKNEAKHVVNVDASSSALEVSKFNIENNGLSLANTEHLQTDVFELLRSYHNEGKKFDVIILDPPKFVDSKHNLNRAARGYKDINRLAFGLLNKGGYLLTFSCSGLMPAELFQKVVADGALDAQVDAQIIKRLEQDEDHPISTAFPEGYYLKGLICRV